MLDDNNIHQIAILDIRILNCDRNLENILIKKVEKNKFPLIMDLKLIPIDHGFKINSYWSWPFKIRPKCLRNFRIANALLKKADSSGLNLYEIGRIIYR